MMCPVQQTGYPSHTAGYAGPPIYPQGPPFPNMQQTFNGSQSSAGPAASHNNTNYAAQQGYNAHPAYAAQQCLGYQPTAQNQAAGGSKPRAYGPGQQVKPNQG